jgi:hypothetical protein
VSAVEREQIVLDRNTCTCSRVMTQNKNRRPYDLTYIQYIYIYIYRYVSHFLQAMKALRESRGIALLCFETSALEGGEGSYIYRYIY